MTAPRIDWPRLLGDIAYMLGEPDPGNPDVRVPCSQERLASALGVARHAARLDGRQRPKHGDGERLLDRWVVSPGRPGSSRLSIAARCRHTRGRSRAGNRPQASLTIPRTGHRRFIHTTHPQRSESHGSIRLAARPDAGSTRTGHRRFRRRQHHRDAGAGRVDHLDRSCCRSRRADRRARGPAGGPGRENERLRAAAAADQKLPQVVYEPETPHGKEKLAASATGSMTVAQVQQAIDEKRLPEPVTSYLCVDGYYARRA